MSPEVGGLFGWVVREGVTNVVRHSSATKVRITLDATGIEIVDDGAGCPKPPTQETAGIAPSGHGLVGLAERADALGGRLFAGPVDGSGFRLRVEVPA